MSIENFEENKKWGPPCFFTSYFSLKQWFKADLAAILKRYCCHGNVTYNHRNNRYRMHTWSRIMPPSAPGFSL